MTCAHANTEPWRRGKWEPDGKHGPESVRIVTGETMFRSWTYCRLCGTRLERAVLHQRPADEGATDK